MTNKVFLFYFHEDAELAEAIEPRLQELLQLDSDSVDVFDAQSDIVVGENVRERVRGEMEAAEFVVVVFSSNSDRSDWQSYEMGMADELGKRVVIVGQKGCGTIGNTRATYCPCSSDRSR